MVSINITVDVSKLPNFEGVASKIEERSKNLIAQSLLQHLQTNSPVDHGLLRKWAPSELGDIIRITSPAEYAQYVNDGTGIYGPKGTPIYSKKVGKPLVFEADGRTVFTRKVDGIAPRRFVEQSIEQTQNEIDGLVIKATREAFQ